MTTEDFEKAVWLNLSKAIDALLRAERGAEKSAPKQGRVGLIRAARICATIASDYRAAEDYGPAATADEILRYVLGEFSTQPTPPLPPTARPPLPPSLHQ